MGLLAELLVRTYHESQHKPVYLVAEEVNAPPLVASAPPRAARDPARSPPRLAAPGAGPGIGAGAGTARPRGAGRPAPRLRWRLLSGRHHRRQHLRPLALEQRQPPRPFRDLLEFARHERPIAARAGRIQDVIGVHGVTDALDAQVGDVGISASLDCQRRRLGTIACSSLHVRSFSSSAAEGAVMDHREAAMDGPRGGIAPQNTPAQRRAGHSAARAAAAGQALSVRPYTRRSPAPPPGTVGEEVRRSTGSRCRSVGA